MDTIKKVVRNIVDEEFTNLVKRGLNGSPHEMRDKHKQVWWLHELQNTNQFITCVLVTCSCNRKQTTSVRGFGG